MIFIKLLSCLRSDIVILDTLIVLLIYLLTYLLTYSMYEAKSFKLEKSIETTTKKTATAKGVKSKTVMESTKSLELQFVYRMYT